MRCPADRTLLSAHQHRQLTFAACASCHGLWFDRPTTLATESVEGLKPPYTEGPLDARSWVGWERRCATCRAGLVSERVGGVEIDRCPACGGLWLDAGELPVEGTVWLAEGVVKFVCVCAEGLLDGL